MNGKATPANRNTKPLKADGALERHPERAVLLEPVQRIFTVMIVVEAFSSTTTTLRVLSAIPTGGIGQRWDSKVLQSNRECAPVSTLGFPAGEPCFRSFPKNQRPCSKHITKFFGRQIPPPFLVDRIVRRSIFSSEIA